MKKDVLGVIAFGVIGLLGALCASCSDGREERKAERLMNENMELTNKVDELRDSIAKVKTEEPKSFYLPLRSYENEADEIGTPRKDLRVEVLSQEGLAPRYYLYEGTTIREIDHETYIVIRHAEEEELCGIRLMVCDCGQYHALHM